MGKIIRINKPPNHILGPKIIKPYDICIGRCHNVMKQLVIKGQGLKGQYEKEDGLEYLENHLGIFLRDYCFIHNVQMKFDGTSADELVVYPSLNNSYIYFISLGLIATDYQKIHPFLDYQFELYPGEDGDFINMIEHVVYYSVGSLSPILNESTRKSYMMSWVSFKRNPNAGLQKPNIPEDSITKDDQNVGSKVKKQTINFNNINVDELDSSLSPFFSEQDKPLLTKLLNGHHIDSQILFQGEAKVFCNVFFELKSNFRIIETKTKIANWICENFQYEDNKNNPVDFKSGYVLKILGGQKTIYDRITLDKVFNLS